MYGSVYLHVAATPEGSNKADLPYLLGGQAQISVPEHTEKHRLSVGVSTCTPTLKTGFVLICPKLALAPKIRVSLFTGVGWGAMGRQ